MITQNKDKQPTWTWRLQRGRLARRRVGSGAYSSGSRLGGDRMSSGIPKGGGKVRSPNESMMGQIESSCLNFAFIIPSR